jgi:histidine kinase/DNA gyrase B/HSP90-like ATPase
MGETRVDLQHLLEDLRDAYPGATESTILTEIVANSLDSGAATIAISTEPTVPALTIVDDGAGMKRRELARYHDIVDPAKEHAFITAFLASWGAAVERRRGRPRR